MPSKRVVRDSKKIRNLKHLMYALRPPYYDRRTAMLNVPFDKTAEMTITEEATTAPDAAKNNTHTMSFNQAPNA